MKIQDKQPNKVGFKKDDNGFLRATVNLGRTGSMQYLGSEIPDAGDHINDNQIYDVHTTSDQLFSDSTIKSFEGVPVTIQHPDTMDVTADNWKDVSVGHVSNVRQNGEHLQGEIIINDPDAVKQVENGLREVSLGYDADLSEKDGIIKKVNIVGNHLAIVDEGRCGASCKINDKKGGIMAKATSWLSRLSAKPKQKKMGDAKAKVLAQKKKLNDANVAFAQSLKDAEAVLASADSTDEQKLEAVQQLQEQASSLQEEAQQAISDATDATEQAQQLAEQVTPADDGTTTNDDDPIGQPDAEAQKQISDLQNQLAEANDKIADLEAQLAQQQETETKATTANDCKRVFPNLKFKDSATSKEMKRQVLVSVGAQTSESVKKMNDCALDSAYHAVIATASTKSVKANNIGKKLTDNAAAKPKLSARQRMGGK